MSLTHTSWYRNPASCFHLFAFRLGRGLDPVGRGLEGLLAAEGLSKCCCPVQKKSMPTGNQEHETYRKQDVAARLERG